MPPALHHIALACRDVAATHHFYGELLGLELVHTEIQKLRGGSVRHFFYDLGDGSSIAFFDLADIVGHHGVSEPVRTAISTDLGLPAWVNHIALRVDADRRRELGERLASAGIKPALELEHGWCHSSYYPDPNGVLIELCVDAPGLPVDADEATRLLSVDLTGE